MGGKSPGVSHNPFLCREQQGWLLRGGGEGWGKGRPWGEGRRARDWGGFTLTCKIQLPHKLGCFLKSDTRINTQTQLHAHMRRRLCIPKGGDLDLPAPGAPRQEPAVSAAPWGGVSPLGKTAWALQFCPPAPGRLNQTHASRCRACASVYAQAACVLAGGARLSPPGLQGMGVQTEEGEGAHRDVLSPTPRGPGLREGGGACLISQPPWQGGPLVLRQPVGAPGVASLTPVKGVLESTGAAAAAGDTVAHLGARPPWASWALQSCRWRRGGSVGGATWPWWPLGCRCHHRENSPRP